MILGNSAFIHRLKNSDTFLSAGIAQKYETQRIHVDISFVNIKNQLDIEKLKSMVKAVKCF